jgi:hypothetical protein
MALHKDLTGTDLHEPKGQATAAINTLYVANGAGSGTHQKIALASLDLTSVQNPNTYRLTGRIDDVSAPSFILIPIPATSVFVSARLVLGGAITVADAVVTLTRNDGASFGSTVTITQAASAEGTGFNFTATTNTTITGPGYIKIATDGASTTTFPLFVTVTLTIVP